MRREMLGGECLREGDECYFLKKICAHKNYAEK
jgi:hypothetical protein